MDGKGWTLHFKNGWGFLRLGPQFMWCTNLLNKSLSTTGTGRMYIVDTVSEKSKWLDEVVQQAISMTCMLQHGVPVEFQAFDLAIEGSRLFWHSRCFQEPR